MCHCIHCKAVFIGYKRRMICKVCDVKIKAEWDALSDKEKEIRSAESLAAARKWIKENIA